MTVAEIRAAIADLPDNALVQPIMDNDPDDDLTVLVGRFFPQDGKLFIGVEILTDDDLREEWGVACTECDSPHNVESTPCGSYCQCCFEEHIEECEVCKSENDKHLIFPR